MRLSLVRTIGMKSLRNYDLVLAAAGWEPRSVHLAKLKIHGAAKKVALYSADDDDDHSLRHQQEYRSLRFQMLEADTSSSETVERFLTESIQAGTSQIFVDISSMTRVWYAGIVRILRDLKRTGKVVVDFGYFPGKYPRDLIQDTPNEILQPLRGFSGVEPPIFPTALLLSLGFDIERAGALVQYFEPKRVCMILASAADLDLEIKALLGSTLAFPVRGGEVFKYNLRDPGSAFIEIESLVSGLEGRHRLIACSLGPKLFGLVLLLVSCTHPRLGVWRATSGRHQGPVLVESRTTYPLVCSTCWL